MSPAATAVSDGDADASLDVGEADALVLGDSDGDALGDLDGVGETDGALDGVGEADGVFNGVGVTTGVGMDEVDADGVFVPVPTPGMRPLNRFVWISCPLELSVKLRAMICPSNWIFFPSGIVTLAFGA
ncbi:MAG: hypothetical protein LKF88_00990 [Microbacteriaceae bacterium]|nr:hypothetical protein [Microbacteriaceae bacterium]